MDEQSRPDSKILIGNAQAEIDTCTDVQNKCRNLIVAAGSLDESLDLWVEDREQDFKSRERYETYTEYANLRDDIHKIVERIEAKVTQDALYLVSQQLFPLKGRD